MLIYDWVRLKYQLYEVTRNIDVSNDYRRQYNEGFYGLPLYPIINDFNKIMITEKKSLTYQLTPHINYKRTQLLKLLGYMEQFYT